MNKAHIIKALSQEILKGWLNFPCIKIDVMYDPIHFTCFFTLHLATCSYLLDPIMHFPLLSWLVLFLPGREYNRDSRISWETRKYKSNKKNVPAYSESTDPQKKKDRRQKRISDHCGATLIWKQWLIQKNLFQVKTNRTSFINFLICYKQKVKT